MDNKKHPGEKTTLLHTSISERQICDENFPSPILFLSVNLAFYSLLVPEFRVIRTEAALSIPSY